MKTPEGSDLPRANWIELGVLMCCSVWGTGRYAITAVFLMMAECYLIAYGYR